MLIRLLEMVAILVAAAFVLQLLRPHPLRRLPWRWRLLGLREPQMAKALQLRRSMVRLLIAGRARDAHGLMADFDRVLAAMADALQAKADVAALPDEARGDRARETQRTLDEAMGWLQAAHGHLCDIARAEIDAAVGDVRSDLMERTEALRVEVEARQEVEAMLASDGLVSARLGDDDAATGHGERREVALPADGDFADGRHEEKR